MPNLRRIARQADIASGPRIERVVGNYAQTLDWLYRREQALRHDGHRIHRVTFRARRQHWIAKIAADSTIPAGKAERRQIGLASRPVGVLRAACFGACAPLHLA